MQVPFDGFVLRKPRTASSNSPFTGEGDVLVRQQDRSAYEAAVLNDPEAISTAYLVQVYETADLVVPSEITEVATKVEDGLYQFNGGGRSLESVVSVTPTPDSTDELAGLVKYTTDPTQDVEVTWEPSRLKINWTSNDERTRFGFDDRKQRWNTLPGSSPEALGAIGEELSLPVVEGNEPLLIVGSQDLNDGVVVPVPEANRVTAAQYQNYQNGINTVPTGEAVLNVESGDLLFADDLTTSYLNQAVYCFRTNFFGYDQSTGEIGVVGSDLYMNPIPTSSESPRIRIEYRSHLRGESSTSLTAPSTGYDYVWNPDTGEIHLDTSLEAEFEGASVYYDGVFSNTEPVESYVHTDLGTIEDGDAMSTTMGNVDFSQYDEDSLLLYIKETGVSISEVDFVAEPADLEDSLNLPATRAQVARSNGQVQLSYALRREEAGSTLVAGTSDFPIENGISFRLAQSPVDPSNNRGLPDGKGVERVVDTVLSDSIPAGPSLRLNQLPLQDVAGYGDDVFFRVQKGPKRRLLEPDVDVIYDFDNQQLQWAQQESHNEVLASPTYSLQLPHQVLHDEGYEFELNEGGGYQNLVGSNEVLANFDSGTLTFIEKVGEQLYEDVGTLTGADTLEATSVDLSGLSVPPEPTKSPILLVGSDAYRVLSSTSTSVTVDRPLDLDGNDTTEFKILEAPEIIYRYAFEQADLRERTVFPYVVTDVDTYVPDGEDHEFVLDGTVVAHVVLESEVLGPISQSPELPVHYRDATAQYKLWREEVELTEVSSNPGPGEYAIDGDGKTLLFNVADEGASVVLDPSLSVGRSTGPVEVLASTGEIGLPADLQPEPLVVRSLVPEDGYTQRGQLLFFEKPFRTGQSLFVRYQTANGTVEDNVGFRVKEDAGRAGSSATLSFGSGRTLDPERAMQVLVNGVPSDLNASASTKTVNVQSVRSGRKVHVSYYALDAAGGEQTASLLQEPFTPPVIFAAATSQQFRGDHTDVLEPGIFMQADDQSFEVLQASYDAGTNITEIELSVPPRETLRQPTVLVTTTPIEALESLAFSSEPNSAGTAELQVRGDQTSTLEEGFLLYLDGDPYYIQGVSYDEEAALTRVVFASNLMREYTQPALVISKYPVYVPDAQFLKFSRIGVDTEPITLIRFGPNGEGSVLEQDFAYTYESGGRIIIEPTVTDAPKDGEVWHLAYTALRSVGPKKIGGQTFLPKFRASYTRRVNASEDNGLQNATLKASYDFLSPDTFFFRAIEMEEYALEVASQIDRNAKAQAASSGPVISTSGSQEIYQKGNEGLIYEGGDLRDQDRAGRVLLAYYNRVVDGFEALLEVIDGRVIGDRDGKFLFELQGDYQPGGVDPITGELLPYYANPQNPGQKPSASDIEQVKDLDSQTGYVRNFIDDLVMVSKKPFDIGSTLPLSFEYKGTFRPMWKPSRLSRLYPEQKQTFTITAPADGGGSYEFPEDFLHILADPKQDSILSIENIRVRAAKARVTTEGVEGSQDGNGGEVRLKVAVGFDPMTGEFTNSPFDPTNPVPTKYLPPFEVGDHVNIGRVTYSGGAQGVDRTTSVYGENLIVTSVGADYIEVKTNPHGGDHPNLTATNATSLNPERGDTVYTIPAVMVDTGAFSLSDGDPPYYRTPLDLFVNASEGELLNTTLPSFMADLLGQAQIEPKTFLDMTVNFRNQSLEPHRFPALDGGTTDDDGDQKPPYVQPFQDSEMQRLIREVVANEVVQNDTHEGQVVDATVLNATTLSVPNLTGLTAPPRRHDLVLIEGVTNGGQSIPFSVGALSTTELVLAAFVVEDASVVYTVENLYEGTGSRHSSINERWEDAVDFTAFSGASSLTLHVDDGAGGHSSYSVNDLQNGYLEVTSPIAESGPANYFLEASGTGSIPAGLHRIDDGTIDFSAAQGALTVSSSGPNNGTYVARGGGSGYLYPEVIPLADTTPVVVGISNAPDIATGTAEAVASTRTLLTPDPVGDVEAGQTLVITGTNLNAGRYTVESVDATATPSAIVVEEPLYTDDGDHTALTPLYPVNWRVSQPRRFSPQVEALQTELAGQRVTYALNSDSDADIQPYLGATSSNPSTPYKERLLVLMDRVFGVPVVSVSGSVSGGSFEGTDFVNAGVEKGDFVVVAQGDNRGFYTVDSIDSGSSPQKLLVSGSNEYTTYSLTDEASTSFEVYRGSIFQPKTYQLILFEYINVLDLIDRLDDGIRMTIHDPDDLEGTPLSYLERPGDPDDATLDRHIQAVDTRNDWIRDQSPNLRQEIEGILKGTEALYDIRYTWIDFRTNLEDGTLARRDRYRENLARRQRKRRKELIKLLSSS
jgi:hypothetical protein